MLALFEVGQREFPVSRRILDAGFEALLLLFPADVQEEFENGDAVLRQYLLEVVDLPIAPVPDLLGNQIVHPDYQDILVMRAVEDSNVAAVGNGFVDAPEKIVRQFLAGGGFE